MWRSKSRPIIAIILIVCCSVLDRGSAAEAATSDESEGNITLTGDLLDLFNLRRVNDLWSEIIETDMIETAHCAQDFESYITGLDNQKIWALKSKCAVNIIPMLKGIFHVILASRPFEYYFEASPNVISFYYQQIRFYSPIILEFITFMIMCRTTRRFLLRI